MLGTDALAPSVDANNAGQPEAFSFTAKEDGPVDIINVYLERNSGRWLIAGIYNDNNGRPGQLLAQDSVTNLKLPGWNSVPRKKIPAVRTPIQGWAPCVRYS